MNQIRMGIIGIGNMGSAHAKSIYSGNVEGMRLTAVCDVAAEKLDWAKENLPEVSRFSDYKDLLASGEVDAIIIATPHYFHPPIAIDAFAAGLHVLTEKPAGVYTSAVRKMNEAAKASGKVFGIMYNQRTTPIFAAAREFIRSGRLGEPKRLVWNVTNWYRTQYYYDSGSWRATWAGEGGGVLMNQCVHNLDLWQWIFGMPQKIHAFCHFGKYHNIEVEDDATIYAEYENGATAVFIASTGDCPGTNRLEITGDRAKIVLEDAKMKIWDLTVPEREFCFSASKNFSIPEIQYSEPNLDAKGPGHNGILRNFAGAILKGTPLLSPGEEGLLALSIINAAYLSTWTGETVTLPLDEERFERLLQEKCKESKIRNVQDALPSSDSGTHSDRWAVRW
ncbi:MAG TPA: Gfo/Idh/MocA family oxidoreductase [Clostridiales bacterium]|jgi:predicted dehydrogenase|nr:Gfo/Idh/MocA family oxidoreductase [Clostridiales bacterium]